MQVKLSYIYFMYMPPEFRYAERFSGDGRLMEFVLITGNVTILIQDKRPIAQRLDDKSQDKEERLVQHKLYPGTCMNIFR